MNYQVLNLWLILQAVLSYNLSMTTKIFLHGGNSGKKSDNNSEFFYEVINSVDSNDVNILCVYFARPDHRWEDSYAEDQSIFYSLDTPKAIQTKMATYDKEKLLNQIKIADIIFINGGMKGHLMEALEGLGNFSELIIGKVVVGISAGANILTKYYYSSVSKGVREGMGLLPIKLLTHYTDQDDDKLKLLMDYKEKLPLLKIAEEDFLILEIPT